MNLLCEAAPLPFTRKKRTSIVRKFSYQIRVALAAAALLALYHPAPRAQTISPATQDTCWNPVGLQEDEVVKAARFAMVEQGRRSPAGLKLLAIKHARLQVLSGSHYSMNLMVQTEGKKHLVIAVVWYKPDGRMELTRWHWV